MRSEEQATKIQTTTNTKFILRLAVLIALTVGSTLIHGQMSQRWKESSKFEHNDSVVRSIPEQLGNWSVSGDGDRLPAAVITELGVTEYVSRTYSDGSRTVKLLLMAGSTERLIRHSPQICYGATGNTFLKEPTPAILEVDGESHELRVLPIRSASNLVSDFTVLYGYANEGRFLSPQNPRLVYHGQPSIKKIQVLFTIDDDRPEEVPEYVRSFIDEVCRYVRKADSKR